MHTYNIKKKNIVLEHSPKIPGCSRDFQDITQEYTEIISHFYLDFYNNCFAIITYTTKKTEMIESIHNLFFL